MPQLDLVFTHDYAEACRLRDTGYEPVECAFGQHGSVLGTYALDHHGAESHREGVALRGCRDHYGALAEDPRFVVTGTPDADAVLCIIALAGLVPAEALPPTFYELVDLHDTDPIGNDLLASAAGEQLAWFNQREKLFQNAAGFKKGIDHMVRLLTTGLSDADRRAVHKSDRARRRKAQEGVLALLDGDGLSVPSAVPHDGAPVLRGDAATSGDARVLVVKSSVWGFDVWYRQAPVVVSYASRMAKVTIGCPDEATAERMFGPGGLQSVWPSLGKGWGGRPAIGGSPRGVRLGVTDAHTTADRLLGLLKG
jgi:hypothetical protein